jgi:hypothetical protein
MRENINGNPKTTNEVVFLTDTLFDVIDIYQQEGDVFVFLKEKL